jgi:CheY-like chemotaxis protein
MIYGFAQQSGGQIRVDSTVGQGTTVRLYLPHHVAAAAVPEAPSTLFQAGLAAPGKSILVVEDESSIRLLVTELLTGLGYDVIEATDSNAGLNLLNSDARIDVLITDVGLPGAVNGRQMADMARRKRPGLPVLFMTGYAESHVLEQCHLQPNTEVLTKPFALETLLSCVKALVREAAGRGA